MREESTDAVMNKYLDFFLFQTFTGMAYSDAKSFDYEQHVVFIDGKDYIDGHHIKTGNEFVTPILPITRKILERNNFNMEITANQKYNQFLKGIGLALGCSFPLTTIPRAICPRRCRCKALLPCRIPFAGCVVQTYLRPLFLSFLSRFPVLRL